MLLVPFAVSVEIVSISFWELLVQFLFHKKNDTTSSVMHSMCNKYDMNDVNIKTKTFLSNKISLN